MPLSDRDRLIATLDRLGSPEDAEALAAARAADAMLKQDNLTWDALIARPDDAAHDLDDAADDAGGDAPGHVHADDDAVAPPVGDTAADIAEIDRLLALSTLSEDTRSMLEDLKSDAKEGVFSAADRRYVQGLRRRLNPAKSA
jgi:hypothetical protein